MSRRIASVLTVIVLFALLAGVASAEATIRDTRTWENPGEGEPESITFSTPETYYFCPEGGGQDTIYTQGVPEDWHLVGWVHVQYMLPDGGRETVPNGYYTVNQGGDLNLTVHYPPIADWPQVNPYTREIHVDLSIEVRDASNALVTWVNPPLGVLGPGAQDWDVFCHRVQDQPGTGTPGYWKNHPEAWPVKEITIGGKTYSMDRAIALMQESSKGDKTYNMFEALVAAKLNVLVNNPHGCIDDTIAAADNWMAAHEVGSGVKANSDAWKEGEPLFNMLDQYNNGLLCAPHRW